MKLVLNMLRGSLVAIITPMEPDGSIDYPALERLVDFHVENGTDGIVSVGTTGESATLTIDEQIAVIGKTMDFAAGRVPIIAGTGGNSTSEAVELTSRAAALGVYACLLVVPYYNKPTQDGLYAHFKHIAESVDIPQILYNVPGRTSLDMINDTVVRLAQIPNIIGIKDATSDIPRVRHCKDGCGSDFAVYSGNDDTVIDLIKAGGDGCISVTANVAPRQMHEMCKAALSGDFVAAAKINATLDPLHQTLFYESNPIPVKWALSEMGYVSQGIRLPLTVFSEQHHDALRQAMRTAGVL